MRINKSEWKRCKRGWPYGDSESEELRWLKDRDALFKENGNGWWVFKGTPQYAQYLKTTKDRLDEDRKLNKK